MLSRLFWSFVRALSLLALLGFITVGTLFATAPHYFTGKPVTAQDAIWHGLSLAFMAAVSVMAAMMAVAPTRYWAMLLPLAVSKGVSSISSTYWYLRYGAGILIVNALVDGAIAILSTAILYVIAAKEIKALK